MFELEATHSHLYPGARGRIPSGAPADGPALVLFVDGAAARARLRADVLAVDP